MNIFLSIAVAAANEAPVTAPYQWIVNAIVISLVIGLIAGVIRALSLKGQLTSVYKNDSAADYTRDKSFKVEVSRDTFLYSKTEKTEKTDGNTQKK